MLTWALCMMMIKDKIEEIPGAAIVMSMTFDVVIVIAITACWWGKYIK